MTPTSASTDRSTGRAATTIVKLVVVFLVLVGGIGVSQTVLNDRADSRPAYDSGGPPRPVRPGEAGAPPLRTANVSAFDGSKSPDAAVQNVTYIERRVLAYTNAERLEHGREALFWNRDMGLVARLYSRELMQRPFQGHTAPNGTDFIDRLARRGYDCEVGAEVLDQTVFGQENPITDGSYGWTNYTTADGLAHGITRDWMQSPSHRRGLLSPEYDVAGVGVYIDAENEVQATMLFCKNEAVDVATDANATAIIADEGVVEDECRLPTAYPNTTSVVHCDDDAGTPEPSAG